MNWKRFIGAMVALLFVLSFLAVRLPAQTTTTGNIAGSVTDPSGAIVPDASVTLKDLTKGTTQVTKSNKDGNYQFFLVAPGTYSLTVTATGFQTINREVQVAVGQIATADFRLSVGTASQTITVTESAPLLQTENGDTSRTISEQQVQNVPNPGNDMSAIAQLAPGAIMNTQGGYGNVEAFGLPATSNLFTTDGMDDNDPFLNLNNSGATNLLLGNNEIQEADVVTNGFSATYGSFGGININYVTKSGSDQFHGNAVYYWNGRALNANDWFNKAYGTPRPFDNANQWAASFGGPIKKDKMFFFINTEGLRVLIPTSSTIFVPTTAFETAVVQNLTNLGDTASIPFYCQNISGVCPGVGPTPGSGNGIFNLFQGAKNLGNAQDTLAPGCVPVPSPGTGCQADSLPYGGCSNVPAIGAFAGLTGPCALSVLETPVNFAPEWQISGRFDWNIGDNDRLFVRMQHDNGSQPTYTDPVNPIFNAVSIQPEYQGQLNETHTFGPTLTNQFLLSATWYTAIFGPPDLASTLNAFPTTLSPGDASLGGPNGCGVTIGGDNCIWPQGRNVTQFQIGDDVSKTIGNHTLHFGAKYHKNYVSDHDFGLFSSGLEIPFSLADFASGGDPNGPGVTGTELLQNFAQSLNQPIRLYEVAGYLQDDWKVKSNLTISPGLRLEHASNPTCVNLCFANLGVPYSDSIPVLPYNQLIQSGRRQAMFGYQNLQWEPRIGFAWQPFSNDSSMLKSQLVVRGGIGIFNDIFPGQIADNLAQNSPLFNPFAIVSANSGAPGATCPGYLSPTQPGGNLFSCASAANAALLTAYSSGATTVPVTPNVTFTPARVYAPTYQKWNLEIQKGFGANDSLSIGYNGNHGYHEPVLNAGVNGYGFGSLPAEPATTQIAGLQEVQSAGVSNYNGVTVSFQHRFSGWGGSGVFQLNYTYSHAFDEVSNGGFNAFNPGFSIESPENPFDLRANYGPADYDARHVVNANYVWQIPIRRALRGHGWAPLVDGWQVSGTIFYRTGFPFTVVDGAAASQLNGYNDFGNGFGTAPFFPVPLTSVQRTCSGEIHAGPNAVPCYAAGSYPTPGLAANKGGETEFAPQGWRNAYRGPNYFDTDFSFTKSTKIPHWESANFQLGLQFFNLFNHYNFNTPISDIANPQFGTIQTGVNPPTSILGSFLGGDAAPRLIQVKAQFVF